ncbi:hypothetical protein [Moorena producens]|uniref:hypothetical protein n=1 Tax=Moorena producens TaxID=1155739 RepID=UPI003C77B15D
MISVYFYRLYRLPGLSIQRSAVSGQPSAKGQRLRLLEVLCGTGFGQSLGHAGRVWPRGARLATLCERRWEITQIKQMVSCCLDPKREWGKPPQVGNGAFSVGELNSPRVAPEASLIQKHLK